MGVCISAIMIGLTEGFNGLVIVQREHRDVMCGIVHV